MGCKANPEWKLKHSGESPIARGVVEGIEERHRSWVAASDAKVTAIFLDTDTTTAGCASTAVRGSPDFENHRVGAPVLLTKTAKELTGGNARHARLHFLR
jgi:hypothetical protein